MAFSFAGVMAERAKVTLIDEDLWIRSCIQWAELTSVPFQVLTLDQAAQGLGQPDCLIVDSEGRPAMEGLLELTNTSTWC